MEPPTLALLIPILAIILTMTLVMLGIVLNYLRRRHLFALYHQERMAALDKGVDLPPLPDGLFADNPRPYHPRRHLLKGLIWTFSGLGLGASIFAVDEYQTAMFALIPIGIGLAHLIYYAVEGKKEAEALGAEKPPLPAVPQV